jgi:hypothetical protein
VLRILDRLSSSFNITEVKHVGADLTNGKADVKLLTFFSSSESLSQLLYRHEGNVTHAPTWCTYPKT